MQQEQSKITSQKLLELLRSLVVEVRPELDREKISLESGFEKELGLDSLSRVELISRIERAFRLSLPESTFAEAENGRDLLRVITTLRPGLAGLAPAATAAPLRSETAALPEDAKTLVEMLEWHAARHGGRLHIRLYQDDGRGGTVTYAQLKSGAQAFSGALQQMGLVKGEPVVIMLPTGADYFFTFFAAAFLAAFSRNGPMSTDQMTPSGRTRLSLWQL